MGIPAWKVANESNQAEYQGSKGILVDRSEVRGRQNRCMVRVRPRVRAGSGQQLQERACHNKWKVSQEVGLGFGKITKTTRQWIRSSPSGRKTSGEHQDASLHHLCGHMWKCDLASPYQGRSPEVETIAGNKFLKQSSEDPQGRFRPSLQTGHRILIGDAVTGMWLVYTTTWGEKCTDAEMIFLRELSTAAHIMFLDGSAKPPLSNWVAEVIEISLPVFGIVMEKCSQSNILNTNSAAKFSIDPFLQAAVYFIIHPPWRIWLIKSIHSKLMILWTLDTIWNISGLAVPGQTQNMSSPIERALQIARGFGGSPGSSHFWNFLRILPAGSGLWSRLITFLGRTLDKWWCRSGVSSLFT